MPYTIASQPPVKTAGTQRRSRWADLFDECRLVPGEWRRMIEPLRKTTAAQIASDIRNAHLRDPNQSRLRGLRPDDQWDAVWGNDPESGDNELYYIWLRYIPVAERGEAKKK